MTSSPLRSIEQNSNSIPSGNSSISNSPALSEQPHFNDDSLSENPTESVQDDNVKRPAEPSATYRIQFHAEFTFQQARAVVPYLAALGVSHVYSSPYLKSVTGSRHGYDIVDQSLLNTDLGSEQDYDDFVDELHAYGMGQILDVVPNHMGVHTNDNAWWMDVLENGPSSPYAAFFDIDWMPLKPDLANKVLLPVLGDQFGKVLESGRLKLHFDEGAFVVKYFDRRFPINVRSSAMLLNFRLSELRQMLSSAEDASVAGASDSSADNHLESDCAELMEYQSILTAINHLPPMTETDPHLNSEARREQEVIKRRLRDLCQTSNVVNDFLIENVSQFNGNPEAPESFDKLDELLLSQAYRLAYWRVAADEINYRRFFDVNELAAICMEQPEVFEKTHRLIRQMIERGQIDGLRVDHPDGLYDPPEYLRRLRKLFKEQSDHLAQPHTTPEEVADLVLGGPLPEQDSAQNHPNESKPVPYLIVEKILGRNERIPPDWPIDGTTGYDFLNLVNGLYVDRNHLRAIDRAYAKFLREPIEFQDLVYQCKKQIMEVSMSSEINVLGHRLDAISTQNRTSRDFTLNSLTDALREVIACFPVYRTYINQDGVSDQDNQYVEFAVARAKRRNPATNGSIFDFVRDVLLLRIPTRAPDHVRQEWHRFVGRFQQVTGPIMAKGVEDTAFYIFNRLVSLNEVGGDPDRFGTTVAAFHQQNVERETNWPHSMLTLSTHDTKRSEDVRARLNVISEMPAEWHRHLVRWSRANSRKKREVDNEPAPSRNDEFLLYQTLLGTWPFEGLTTTNRAMYIERIQNYMAKAAREAKVHTSWVSPHEPYDSAMSSFIDAILFDSNRNAFLLDFHQFASQVSACGIWNSLSQTVLKLTCPGVPDTYQGSETWDFSLVDPDNRRPIDFDVHREMLADIHSHVDGSVADRVEFIRDLLDHPYDGRLKLFVVSQILQLRRQELPLFSCSSYQPVEVSGSNAEHLCAFARRAGERTVVVAAPRLIARLTNFTGTPPIGEELWQDTKLVLPSNFHEPFLTDLFTNATLKVVMNNGRCELPVGDLLRGFPVAVVRPYDSD